MGQVSTQLEDKNLSKLGTTASLDEGSNKQKGPLFDQLADPLVDPLGSGGGGDPSMPNPQDLGAQQGAIEQMSDLTPRPGDDLLDAENEEEDEAGAQSADPTVEGQQEDQGEPDPLGGPDRGEGQDDPQGEGSSDHDQSSEQQKPDPNAKKDPSADNTPKDPRPDHGDATSPGSETGGGGDTGGDSAGGEREDQGQSGPGGGGLGPDGALLDYEGLTAGELSEYVNEKAWHDYWAHGSDTGMAVGDRFSLVGRAMGAGMLEGLVGGVSAGLIQGVVGTALKGVRYAGGLFTAVEIFRQGPANWAMQGPEKFKGAIDKWSTGDTVDRVEAVIDVIDGINTIIGQISGICMMVAGLGSVVAAASIFFPFLLPIVPFLLTVIPMAAQWGMMLGRISSVIGAAVTLMRLVPITMRAGQILLSDADPAIQAARAEKLNKQVGAFTDDATSRVVKSGTEKMTEKSFEKMGGLLGGNKVHEPSHEPHEKVGDSDKKIGFFKKTLATALDLDNLNPKEIKEGFKKVHEATETNKEISASLKPQAQSYKSSHDAFSESSGKANGLENLQSSMVQNMSQNKVSKQEFKMFLAVGSDASSARSQADLDHEALSKDRGAFGKSAFNNLIHREQVHSGEEFGEGSAKSFRDAGMNALGVAGNDHWLEGLKELPNDGSVGSTDPPDKKLEKSNKKLYDLKMERARESFEGREKWVEGRRDKEKEHNKEALAERKLRFPQGAEEFSEGQQEYSEKLLETRERTSGALVDATLSPEARAGMNDKQTEARNQLKPKVMAAMDKVDAVRASLAALPPPPEPQESILTNSAENFAKIDAEIQALQGMKGTVAQQRAAAIAQVAVGQRALALGQQNTKAALDEQKALEEKKKKRQKAEQDLAEKQARSHEATDPLQGFMAGVADMVGYLLQLAGVLPDSVGGDQLKAADPKGLQTGLEQTQRGGQEAGKGLGEGVRVAGQQSKIGALAENWMNSGLTGLMGVNARLARDQAESQSASQQYASAESTLLDRLAKLEAGREAQRQRHATAMATLETWTQTHRAERLKKQGDLDADLEVVNTLLQGGGAPAHAE